MIGIFGNYKPISTKYSEIPAIEKSVAEKTVQQQKNRGNCTLCGKIE